MHCFLALIKILYNNTDSQNETFFVGKFQNQEILKELRSVAYPKNHKNLKIVCRTFGGG